MNYLAGSAGFAALRRFRVPLGFPKWGSEKDLAGLSLDKV